MAISEMTVREAEFFVAAKEYCRLWTSDNRNTTRPDKVWSQLDFSRHVLYMAYRNLLAREESSPRTQSSA